MTRFLPAAFLAGAFALALGACDDTSSSYPYASPLTPTSSGVCSQYRTCGSCTPVTGCGWCFTAKGGTCATDPDQCAGSGSSEFTWTWDQAGCPGVDASVAPLDAGAAKDGNGAAETGAGTDASEGGEASTDGSAGTHD